MADLQGADPGQALPDLRRELNCPGGRCARSAERWLDGRGTVGARAYRARASSARIIALPARKIALS
eukprot:4255237-Pyramimonas_sp.AAC.1